MDVELVPRSAKPLLDTLFSYLCAKVVGSSVVPSRQWCKRASHLEPCLVHRPTIPAVGQSTERPKSNILKTIWTNSYYVWLFLSGGICIVCVVDPKVHALIGVGFPNHCWF